MQAIMPRTASARCEAAQCGFTLVEVIVVMVIMGVLAAVAVPRLTQSDAESRETAEHLRSALRYAQRIAVTRNRDVCVTVTAATVTFRAAGTAGTAVACVASLPPLTDSNDTIDLALAAGSSVQLTSTRNFRFTPSGGLATLAGVALTMATTPVISIRRGGALFATMTIEPDNGFILASTF